MPRMLFQIIVPKYVIKSLIIQQNPEEVKILWHTLFYLNMTLNSIYNKIQMEGNKNMIKARGVIPIFYSSVTNTSKRIAYMLQEKLQQEQFVASVTNIGDVDQEQFLELTGPAIFIMSTYGNGGSPADGQDFLTWLKQLDPVNHFQHLEVALLGLGNRTFQHYCGNSKTIRQCMLKNGAKQIIQFVTCNSAAEDQTAFIKFPQWSKNLIDKLKQKFEIKEMKAQDLLQTTKAIITNDDVPQDDWQKNREEWQKKLGKEFLAFNKSYKADVIHIRQMRTENDGRSTLWIRMKIPEGLKLQPACNVSVYPENVRKPEESKFPGSVKIQTRKKNGKVPYPPMPYERLWQISNLNQTCDINTLNYGLAISQEEPQTKEKYLKLIKNVQEYEKNPVRCIEVYKQLNPGPDFLVKLGINTIRPYTLASWEPEKQYFDLVVSISPQGLCSKYFQSSPTQLRVNLTTSSFYAPSGRPIIMIANGTGIAPFRSLVQYILKHETQPPKLYLYFGIQNKKVDYYFGQEWENLEKQGKIVLRIAQSRVNPDKKVYVQNLIKQDKQLIAKHLFEENGLIFLCGGASMAKAVDTELFQVIKIKHPIPFKAFKASKQMENNKTIVKEVYH